MQWAEVINDPCLRDLPYKVELNCWGNIERWVRHRIPMPTCSPKSLFYCIVWLHEGRIFTEASIKTAVGVRVPDVVYVVWMSDIFAAQHGFETPFSAAPEICIEITSLSNS